jgi:hypothetical protein
LFPWLPLLRLLILWLLRLSWLLPWLLLLLAASVYIFVALIFKLCIIMQFDERNMKILFFQSRGF